MVKGIIEDIVGVRVSSIKRVDAQKAFVVGSNGGGLTHSRCDVLCESDNSNYNIEIQTTRNGNIAERISYYNSLMMVHLNRSAPSRRYRLKKSISIVFYAADIYAGCNPISCFEYKDANNVALGDGTMVCFVNYLRLAQEVVSNSCHSFCNYLVGEIDYRSDTQMYLLNRAVSILEDEEWRNAIMSLEERLEEKLEEGLQRGLQEGLQ